MHSSITKAINQVIEARITSMTTHIVSFNCPLFLVIFAVHDITIAAHFKSFPLSTSNLLLTVASQVTSPLLTYEFIVAFKHLSLELFSSLTKQSLSPLNGSSGSEVSCNLLSP